MNSIVTPAVTSPSATQAVRLEPVNIERRGRTMTSNSTPAHASRNHATRPRRPVHHPDRRAQASWTQVIDDQRSIRHADEP
jgi:hypothetical protein